MISDSELATLRKLHRHMIDGQLVPSCFNCAYFVEKEEQCVRWKVRPPAATIVYGCESWEGDIPF